MARVEKFFGRRTDFQRSETLKRRKESREERHRHGPLLQDDAYVDQLIRGLSDPDHIDESITSLCEYSLIYPVVLNKAQFSVLFEALDCDPSPSQIDGLFDFLEILVAANEDFNIEGMAQPHCLETLLSHFPNPPAIRCASAIVRHGNDRNSPIFAADVFAIQSSERWDPASRPDFASWVDESSASLAEVLDFLCAFAKYELFNDFLRKTVLPRVFGLERCDAVILFLINASLNPALRTAIAFAHEFPEVFAEGVTELQLELLHRVFRPPLDLEPILISHGETFMRFIVGCFEATDDDGWVQVADVAGFIATVGQFRGDVVDCGIDGILMAAFERDWNFESMSSILIAASRMIIHAPFEAQVAIMESGFADSLAGLLDAMTDGAITEIFTSFIRAVEVGQEAGDARFAEMLKECEPVVEAAQKLREEVTDTVIRCQLDTLFFGEEDE
jgi:hypothetical protein